MIDESTVVNILVDEYGFQLVSHDTPMAMSYLQDGRGLKYAVYTIDTCPIISTSILGESIQAEISSPIQIRWYLTTVKVKILEGMQSTGCRAEDVYPSHVQTRLIWE